MIRLEAADVLGDHYAEVGRWGVDRAGGAVLRVPQLVGVPSSDQRCEGGLCSGERVDLASDDVAVADMADVVDGENDFPGGLVQHDGGVGVPRCVGDAIAGVDSCELISAAVASCCW